VRLTCEAQATHKDDVRALEDAVEVVARVDIGRDDLDALVSEGLARRLGRVARDSDDLVVLVGADEVLDDRAALCQRETSSQRSERCHDGPERSAPERR